MEEQVTGTLADGRTYRATPYAVEILDAQGAVVETIDLSEVMELRREGLDVTFRRRKGKTLTLRGATLADAGRLETTVRPAIPQAPAKSGGRIGGLFKWGCLGTLALVALIVISTMLTGGSSDGDSGAASTGSTTTVSGSGASNSLSTKEVGTNEGDVHFPLEVGAVGEVQQAKDKLHRVTIVSITDNATSSNEFEKPSNGHKFWVVEILVENAGPAEIYVGSWKLRTTADFEYDPTIAVGFGEPLNLVQNLTSGAKTQGVVVFEVPEDAQPKFLRYDPNILAKGDLYFDAQ